MPTIRGNIYEVTNVMGFFASYFQNPGSPEPDPSTFRPLSDARIFLPLNRSDFPTELDGPYVPASELQTTTDDNGAFSFDSALLPSGSEGIAAYLLVYLSGDTPPFPGSNSTLVPIYRSEPFQLSWANESQQRIYIIFQPNTAGIHQSDLKYQANRLEISLGLDYLDIHIQPVRRRLHVEARKQGAFGLRATVTFNVVIRPSTSPLLDRLLVTEVKNVDVDLPGPDPIIGLCRSETEISRTVLAQAGSLADEYNVMVQNIIVDSVAQATGLSRGFVRDRLANASTTLQRLNYPQRRREIVPDICFGFPCALSYEPRCWEDVWSSVWGTGWTTFMPFVHNSKTHYLAYKVSTGDVVIDRIKDDLQGVDTVWGSKWSTEWTTFMPFIHDGKPHYLAYKYQTGDVVIDRIKDDLQGVDTMWDSKWGTGWTTFMPFIHDGKPHYLAYKVFTGDVVIERIKDDLQGVDTLWSSKWGTGWTTFMPFIQDGKPHYLAYKYQTGDVVIDRIQDDLQGVDTVWDSNWGAGWTTFMPYVLNNQLHLITFKAFQGTLWIIRMGQPFSWGVACRSTWNKYRFIFMPFQILGKPYCLSYSVLTGTADIVKLIEPPTMLPGINLEQVLRSTGLLQMVASPRDLWEQIQGFMPRDPRGRRPMATHQPAHRKDRK